MFYPISQHVYTNSRQQQFIPDSLHNIISFDYNSSLAKTVSYDCCTKKTLTNNIDGNTAHISVVDSQDNVVSLTQTVGPLMGSGVITDSLGFVYATTMGSYLGMGYTFQTAKKKFMPNDTVEGEQLAREIAPFVLKKINKQKIPLMVNLIKTIQGNKKLKIKV